jgi:hypothetical protein
MLYALCFESKAQSIDYTKDGRHYYIASPNGRYFTGTVNEGPGCFFDAETKQHCVTEEDSVLIVAVNNDGKLYRRIPEILKNKLQEAMECKD